MSLNSVLESARRFPGCPEIAPVRITILARGYVGNLNKETGSGMATLGEEIEASQVEAQPIWRDPHGNVVCLEIAKR
jgi:hypothetical protein